MTTQQMPATTGSNALFIKGLITGALTLLLLIPAYLINGLVAEREMRQKEVVKEVSSKWAGSQTLSGPYISIPCTDSIIDQSGKKFSFTKNLLILPETETVTSELIPEQRPRSIYKVLLYKANINFSGNFKFDLPADVNSASLDYSHAKLCFSLSDFKGIDDDITVRCNNQNLQLVPGLPDTSFGSAGLSAPITLQASDMQSASFNLSVRLKGSEQLHFLPLAASSKFKIKSAWSNPSFDGDVLPAAREISDKGFSAEWNFARANHLYGTVLKEATPALRTNSFGLSLVQPADQYNKTMRSVKYAILFIGLTFALFFITEIMQKKPFHPVQYVLVGLALVIFYILLLSLSEYILFDRAYAIAAAATVALISLYAKGHFGNWKTAGVFFTLLSALYGFIFILIRLEDTALLAGSIGLFIVLACVMYISRKINWYGAAAITGKHVEI